MRKCKRNIVSFYDLPTKWQKEAVKNLGQEMAEEAHYLQPWSKQSPKKHILWDLSECMRLQNDSDFNAYIIISNNSAMLLKIDDIFETAIIKFV